MYASEYMKKLRRVAGWWFRTSTVSGNEQAPQDTKIVALSRRSDRDARKRVNEVICDIVGGASPRWSQARPDVEYRIEPWLSVWVKTGDYANDRISSAAWFDTAEAMMDNSVGALFYADSTDVKKAPQTPAPAPTHAPVPVPTPMPISTSQDMSSVATTGRSTCARTYRIHFDSKTLQRDWLWMYILVLGVVALVCGMSAYYFL